MQLEEMMSFCSNVDLRFTNGIMPASMAHLGAVSSVLRGAIDTHNSNNSSSSTRLQIGMDDLSKEEWMQVARFLYPLSEAAIVQGWQEAALLLRAGAQFDMPLLMQAADQFISKHAHQLVRNSSTSGPHIWEWMRLADQHNLKASMAGVAAQAARTDREGCSIPCNLEHLSWAATRVLVMVLVPVPPCCTYCPSPPHYSPCSPRYDPDSPQYSPTSPVYQAPSPAYHPGSPQHGGGY